MKKQSPRKLNNLMWLLVVMFLCPSLALAQASFDRFVVFGTSLSDPGNMFASNKELNLPPSYAVDELLVPDAPYARGGHHLSNGATWVEQLAKPLGMARSVLAASRSNNPHAMNFAIDGTRASNLVFSDKKLFSQQVDHFLADVNNTASVDALYVIEIGSNDVRDALGALLTVLQGGGDFATAEATAQAVLENALVAIATEVNRLQDAGAQKFLYLTAPPIGVTPAVLALDNNLAPFFGSGSVAFWANTLATEFNNGLETYFNSLVTAEVVLLDVYAITNAIIADPEGHGLTVVDAACITPYISPFVCQNPDEYFFWDGIHPTKAAYTLFANEAAIALEID